MLYARVGVGRSASVATTVVTVVVFSLMLIAAVVPAPLLVMIWCVIVDPIDSDGHRFGIGVAKAIGHLHCNRWIGSDFSQRCSTADGDFARVAIDRERARWIAGDV